MKAENTKDKFVVDASAWLAWLLPDEKVPDSLISYFDLFGEEKAKFMAPTLLKYEFANALKSNFLRKRIGKVKAVKILMKLLALDIEYVNIDFKNALNIAIKEKISFYDASYVSLAKELKLQLLSLDKKLFEIK